MPTARLALLALSLTLVGCRSTGAPASEVAAVRSTLDELYAAFSFDPGAQPDWHTQRRIYLEGAAFVAPIRVGRQPRAVGTQAFLADFEAFAMDEPFATSGLHERIIGTRVDVFGGIAHAYVAFEGFEPGDGAALTRGLDSIQLVRDAGAWRLVSFTTQYEDEASELLLPRRFRD